MLTRNFDNIMVGYLTVFASGSTEKESEWSGGRPGVVKTQYGMIKSINKYPGNGYTIFGNANNSEAYEQLPATSGSNFAVLIVGSNNAEETYNDYSLNIIKDLTVIGSRYVNTTYSEEGCVYNTVKTFVNNTENDIIVNELGLYQHYDSTIDVLLYRKKLDKSVTLKANGGTATFNLVIKIPYANKP